MNNDLQQRVDEALDAAVFENGYTDLMELDAEALAVDTLDCSLGLEDEDLGWVTACAKDYLAWYWERPGVARIRTRRQ